MKILQIGNYPENENAVKGGIQSSLFGLVSELIRKNHTVEVISLPNRSLPNDHGIERGNLRVYYFANRRKYNSLGVYRFFHIVGKIKTCRADICHLHGTDLLVFFLYLFCRLNKTPSIITVHGLAYVEKRNAYYRKKSLKNFAKLLIQSFFEFMLLNVITKVIVDTQYVADSFTRLKKRRFLFRLPEFYIIPQGINEQFFKLPDNYDRLKILSVGSIGERKGHLFLIKAIERLIPDFPLIKLNIIGSIANASYHKTLNDYISTNNLKENIEIRNYLTFDDLMSFYSTCNIFTLHSEEESQGIVFCEAMACGKPIVATNSGGIPDVVTDGKSGFLSSFSNVVDFSENIRKILINDELRRQLSLYNKEHALQYSWSVIADEILNVYAGLIK